MGSMAFVVAAVLAFSFLALMLFLALFEPGLAYRIETVPDEGLDSDRFLRMLGGLACGEVHRDTAVDVLRNGDVYYEVELEAIARATHSVNLEAYVFHEGRLTQRFLDALAESARRGVEVRLVIDSVGSLTTRTAYFDALRTAGGKVAFYHPIRWHTLPRINNRTHRELIIVDGRVGFIGGSGFADQWRYPRGRRQPWRDTMFRVEGEVVRSLQATFVENWVESSGEILTGHRFFPQCPSPGTATALVVPSSPTTGLSTRARLLFQTLVASAGRSLAIATPYFLPDSSLRRELVRAVRERGVGVRILTPGRHSDQLLTRRSSRRLYGELLEAGARIFEYRPAMMHAKVLVIDELWSVVGSTNLDNRSFGLNDEVNLAVRDAGLAGRLLADFALDLSVSQEMSYRAWRKRPMLERASEFLGSLLERQQ
jgi:cardiolipin synthase A/B